MCVPGDAGALRIGRVIIQASSLVSCVLFLGYCVEFRAGVLHFKQVGKLTHAVVRRGILVESALRMLSPCD